MVLCKAYAVTVILQFRFGKKAERTSMLFASKAYPVPVPSRQEGSENTRAANIYVCNTLCIFTTRDAICKPYHIRIFLYMYIPYISHIFT